MCVCVCMGMNVWDRVSELGPISESATGSRGWALALLCAPCTLGASPGRATLTVRRQLEAWAMWRLQPRPLALSPSAFSSVQSAAMRWWACAAGTSPGQRPHWTHRGEGLREQESPWEQSPEGAPLSKPAVLPESPHAPHGLHPDLADCRPRGWGWGALCQGLGQREARTTHGCPHPVGWTL